MDAPVAVAIAGGIIGGIVSYCFMTILDMSTDALLYYYGLDWNDNKRGHDSNAPNCIKETSTVSFLFHFMSFLYLIHVIYVLYVSFISFSFSFKAVSKLDAACRHLVALRGARSRGAALEVSRHISLNFFGFPLDFLSFAFYSTEITVRETK